MGSDNSGVHFMSTEEKILIANSNSSFASLPANTKHSLIALAQLIARRDAKLHHEQNLNRQNR
jgi:hypothetical protein